MLACSARTSSCCTSVNTKWCQRQVNDIELLRLGCDQKATGRNRLHMHLENFEAWSRAWDYLFKTDENILCYMHYTLLYSQSKDRPQSLGCSHTWGHSSGSAKCCGYRCVGPHPPSIVKVKLSSALLCAPGNLTGLFWSLASTTDSDCECYFEV